MSDNINDDNDRQNNLPVKSNNEIAVLKEHIPMNGNQTEGPRKEKKEDPIPLLNGPISAKSLAEAVVTALAVILLVLAWFYIPLFSTIIPFFLPLPLVLISVRRGFNNELIAIIIALAVIVFITNPITAAYIFLQIGLIALYLGYSFRLRKPGWKTLIITMVLLAIGTLVSVIIPALGSGYPWYDIFSYSTQTMSDYFDTWTSAVNVSSLLLEGMTLAEYKTTFLDLISRVLPSYYIIFAFLQAFITYLLATSVVRRSGYKTGNLPPFEEWRLHWILIWGVIIGLALRSLGSQFSWEYFSLIGQNIIYVYYPILLICGFAFFVWFFKRWRAGILLKLIFVILLSFNLIATSISLMLIAVFDPLVNFRDKLRVVFMKR